MSPKDESSIPEISEKILLEVNASTTPMPAEVNISTAPIPSTHVSNSSSETSPGNTSKTAEVSTSSTTSSSKVGSSNRSRLPISILPDDPEEKRKHIIGCARAISLSILEV
jgi:hypothetical protein